MVYDYETEYSLELKGVKNPAGIPKITLPYLAEEITRELVEKELPYVLSRQEQNAYKIEYMLAYADGTFQEIDNKTRTYETDKDRNKIVKENHAYSLVNFKEGFLLGNKREFAQKSDTTTDDIIFLDRFLCDCAFYTKDIELKHNIYASGIGTSYIVPRTDIIKETSKGWAVFNQNPDEYDVENDSPFVYEVLESSKNAVVYTNRIGVYGDGALFCFSIRNVRVDDLRSYKEITVWTKEWTAKYTDKEHTGEYKLVPKSYVMTAPNYKFLPMIEHSLNKSRTGLIEIDKTCLDAANMIASSSLDNVVDLVNQILAFLNVDADKIDLKKMYEAGAICLPPTGAGDPKIEKIVLELKYEAHNIMFEQRLTRLYDIAGVPLASASVTSGGDTGQARLLGGGWTNAYTVINRDILSFEKADRELLKRMIAICKINPNNPVNEVNANQVEIKYNINMSDNLLVKTQSMQTLYGMHFPLEDILRAVPVVSDIKTVSKRWEEESNKAKTEEAKAESLDKMAEKPQIAQKTEKSIIAE